MKENKKDLAVSFLQLASSGKVRQAYRKYVHPHIHHYYSNCITHIYTQLRDSPAIDAGSRGGCTDNLGTFLYREVNSKMSCCSL
jgi:hypothetical protein